MKFYQFIFLTLLVLIGCNQSNIKENKDDKKNGLLSSFSIKPGTKAVLIVPLDGCNGCANKSLEFIKQHQNKSYVQYILSASNKKDIDILLKSTDIIINESLIMDSSNKTTSQGLTNGYPTICYFNSSPVVIKKLSVDNIETELTILLSNINHWNSNKKICEFDALDIKPKYIGGINKFYSFVYDNVKYPEQAKNNKVEGRAIIELIIDNKGKIDKVSTLRDFYNCCGEEFQQAILQSPRWIPGQKNGKEVSSRMILPVRFKLD